MCNFLCLLFVLKQSYVCYYVISMAVPLRWIFIRQNKSQFRHKIYLGMRIFICLFYLPGEIFLLKIVKMELKVDFH